MSEQAAFMLLFIYQDRVHTDFDERMAIQHDFWTILIGYSFLAVFLVLLACMSCLIYKIKQHNEVSKRNQ